MKEEKGLVPELRFGEFAEDWRKGDLRDVIHLISGQHLKPDQYNTFGDGNPYFTGPSDFTDSPEQVDKWSKNGNEATMGDTLLCVKGSGVGAIHLLSFDAVKIGRQLMALRTKLMNSDLLFHLLPLRQTYFERLSRGNMIPGITREDILSAKIVLPSLPEQRKIAAFLTAVDGRLSGLRRKRAALERYKRGVMQGVFSDARTEGWSRVTIDEVYSFYSTNSLSRAKLNHQTGEVKSVHYGDIHTRYGSYLDAREDEVPFINGDVKLKGAAFRQQVRTGDVLLADASEDIADIGKATEVVATGSVPIYAGLHTIHARPRPSKLELGFSGVLFRSPMFRREVSRIAQGAKVLGISPTTIGKIQLPIPSLPEQRRIATFLRALDDRIALVDQQLAGAEVFKRGLLQKMFV